MRLTSGSPERDGPDQERPAGTSAALGGYGEGGARIGDRGGGRAAPPHNHGASENQAARRGFVAQPQIREPHCLAAVATTLEPANDEVAARESLEMLGEGED